jgi:signal transduction histidine kinase
MPDIYARKSNWKWYLAFGGAIIILISLLYTKYLADRLAAEEVYKAEQFAEAIKFLTKSSIDTSELNCDVTLSSQVILNNNTIPVVILDENNRIELYRNIGDSSLQEMDTSLVRVALNEMISDGAKTIRIDFQPHFTKYLVYTNSRLLSLLQWYPFIQMILIGAFIALGYLGFSSSRNAEENQVWVGMAKETAHQLGTPISAIIGWIEALKSTTEDNQTSQEMLGELRNDVSRLELIADRFSKIGAVPELTPHNIYDELEKSREYMKRRSPRRVEFDFPNAENEPPIMVQLNSHLFEWVLENLLRNAIDSLEDGKGVIKATIYQELGYTCIDIADTGKGIPANKHNMVFKPGYSTKTRGWGLGLSLSKRIIKEYHGGKIFVKTSEIGKGTTFTIKLPTS